MTDRKKLTMPKLHSKQQMIAQSNARFRVVVCGRRFGKTRLGVWLAFAAALIGKRVWWVSYTFDTASPGLRLLQTLFAQIPSSRFEKVHKRWSLPNGGFVQVRTAQDPDALRGEGLDLIIWDEAAFCDSECWHNALRPALGDRRGSCVFLTTPAGHNWFYEDIWTQAERTSETWQRWQLPTSENPFIDADEIEAMRAEMHEQRFRQEILAEFVALIGRVFPDFSRERHVRAASYDENLPVVVGFDFGYRTAAMVAGQDDKHGTLRIFADAEWHDLNTHQAMERLASYPWSSDVRMIGCDPAANSVDIQSGIRDVDVVRRAFPEANVTFSMNPRHRSPEGRASIIRDYLWSSTGVRKLVIDPAARATIKTLEMSVYPEPRPGSGEKQEPIKDGVIDHTRDALGYLVVNAFHREPAGMVRF